MTAMWALGWECAVCGATRDIADPLPFRCPNATLTDRHHVLHLRSRDLSAYPRTQKDHENDNPFVRYDERMAWSAFAEANGMSGDARGRLVATLDAAIVAVDGTGFATTPFERSEALSDLLGFSGAGGIWVKDETHAVGGSQKARHLMSILLHLLAAEALGLVSGDRPRLAIASCGNAALAAATLAKAASWPIDVFVPTWMGDGVGARLDALDATIHRCERLSSDPPGDPAMFRFREAVADGSVPFTVQGPENALCLDGGRTIAWELVDQSIGLGVSLDRVFVQVGGGALATSIGDGLECLRRDSAPTGEPSPDANVAAGPDCSGSRLHAVQAAGCAPLARAWERAASFDRPADHWAEAMTVWDDPHSLADGILDDETYDWIGIVDHLRRTDGSAVVASEADIVRAHELARSAGFDVSPTGSAGLAGVLTARADPAFGVGDDERIALVMSGIAR